jgi:hypothetical protein
MNKRDIFIGFLVGSFFAALYYFAGKESVPATESSSTVSANPKVKESVKRDITDEVKTKFLKPEQIKIKPKEDQSPKTVATSNVSEELQAEQADLVEKGYGSFPPVSTTENMNPQKASVIEALQTGKNPERLSIVGKRETFNKEEYLKNPSDYLNVSVPSRAFDAAQPGDGIPRLTRVTPQFIETYQNEPVEIVVNGALSGFPVSILTTDGGKFVNDLSAMTVKADSSGTAVFYFTATEGVINDCRISVASPLSSGVVKFIVNVKKKREL